MLRTCFHEEHISDMGREEETGGKVGPSRRCLRAHKPIGMGAWGNEFGKHTCIHTPKIPRYLVCKKKWSTLVEDVERQEIFSVSFIWRTVQEGLAFLSSVQHCHFIDVDYEWCDRPCLGQTPKLNPCSSAYFWMVEGSMYPYECYWFEVLKM